MSDPDYPLPPPTFEFLVFSLKTQAEMQLGLISFGEKPEPPNLDAASHAIDLLAMIADKTRGNLSLEEQRLIENSLTELRFRFVQVRAESEKPATPAPRDIRRIRGSGVLEVHAGNTCASQCSARAPARACPPSAAVRHVRLHRPARQPPAPVRAAAVRRQECADRHHARFRAAGAARGHRPRGRDPAHARARRSHPGPGRRAPLELSPEDVDSRYGTEANVRNRAPRFPLRVRCRALAIFAPRVDLHTIADEPFDLFGLRVVPTPLDARPLRDARIPLRPMPPTSPITAIFPMSSKPLLRNLDVLFLDALRHRPHPTHSTVDAQSGIGEGTGAAARILHAHLPRLSARANRIRLSAQRASGIRWLAARGPRTREAHG